MSTDYSMLYQQIGRLLESAPDLSTYEACVMPVAMKWFGRAHATVSAVYSGNDIDIISLRSAVDRVRSASWGSAVTEIFQILYRALGHCEVRMPAGLAGAFVPVGNSFDAFSAVAKIFAGASGDVLIVDPYLDHSVLAEFGVAVPEYVSLRLLADETYYKSTLSPAAGRWRNQYGEARPLSVRLAPSRSLHDRAIFIDKKDAWTLTQSLKDFAKRAPAEIVRADSIAALKILAYEEIWANATVLL